MFRGKIVALVSASYVRSPAQPSVLPHHGGGARTEIPVLHMSLRHCRSGNRIGCHNFRSSIAHHVRGELLVVVPERDDEPLAGVGGEADVDLLQVVGGTVRHLGRREVEVAELARPDHQHVGVVGARRDARDADLRGTGGS